MDSLDSLDTISKLDKQRLLSSIEHLPNQIEQAWQEVKEIEIPDSYKKIENILLCGMGGSALGGRVVNFLTKNALLTPFEVSTEYFLPNYVNSKTLVILSSYSGGTEETLKVAHEALKKNAKIFGIATGGPLGEFFKKENLPCYVFDPRANPSGQPRMSLGYSITTILSLFTKLKFINITDQEIKTLIKKIDVLSQEFGVRNQKAKNEAKSIAHKLFGKGILILGSEHLTGIAHAFKNQLNENSKTYSGLFDIPEANHHLLEGLRFPQKARETLSFLFLESPKYFERVLRRYPITKDIVEKNSYSFAVYKTTLETKLEEVFEILILGSYISFYLAILNNIDPAPIPWVDYFKKQLA